MGDHRASIKIEFEMHGVTSKADMWVNWNPHLLPFDLPHCLVEFFSEAQQKSLAAYLDANTRAEDERLARQKALIESAKSKLSPEELEALRDATLGIDVDESGTISIIPSGLL